MNDNPTGRYPQTPRKPQSLPQPHSAGEHSRQREGAGPRTRMAKL